MRLRDVACIFGGALLLLVVGAAATPAIAAELYVDARSASTPCGDNRSRDSARSPSRPFCSIEAALRRTRSGDAVFVAPGDYPRLRIRNFRPARRVTLNGASGRMGAFNARLEYVELSSSRRLLLSGFRVTERVTMRNSADVRISGNVFRNGLSVLRSSRVKINENRFPHAAGDAPPAASMPGTVCPPRCRASLDIRDSAQLSVIRNGFTASPAGGLRLQDVEGVKINRNRFKGQPPEDGRVATVAVSLSTPTRDVLMSGNEMQQTRGIYAGLSARVPAAHIGLEIVNNELIDMDDWAMNLHAAPGARIINNTAWRGESGVIIAEEPAYRDRTRGAVVINNLFERLAAPADALAVEDYNLIADGSGVGPHDIAAAPDFFRSATCPWPCGFGLLATSPGIDAGTSRRFDIEVRAHNGRDMAQTARYTAVPPARDINSKRRHDLPATDTGDGPVPFIDIGAHEADGRNP